MCHDWILKYSYMTQVGIQLHSLRELNNPLPEILRHVDAHGFDVVEFASRVHGENARSVRTALDETGLVPVGAHVSLSRLETDLEPLLDRCEILGCNRLVVPHIPSKYFLTSDRVKSVAARLNTLAHELGDRGFELVIHNSREMHLPVLDRYLLGKVVDVDAIPRGAWAHLAWGIDQVLPHEDTRQRGFQLLVEATDADRISFEIDVSHLASAGRDPVQLFDLVEDRLFAVHVCDVRRSRWLPPDYEPVDIGDGFAEVESFIRKAVDHGVDWIITENDEPSDPLQTPVRGIETVKPLVP